MISQQCTEPVKEPVLVLGTAGGQELAVLKLRTLLRTPAVSVWKTVLHLYFITIHN